MPTIIAICPYCHAGGVRAPDSAVGASATCPKCRSSFTLLPEDNLPDWAAKANASAAAFSAPSAEKQKSSPLEETSAAAAMPDVTEPSPVLPAERPGKKGKEKSEAKPELAPQHAATSEPTPAAEATTSAAASESASGGLPVVPADMGMVFALLALIMVGPAVLLSQLPFGRFIALGVSGVGLVGALLCLGAEGRARLAAAGAAVAHFFVLIVVLFLPSWLNLDPWRGPDAPEEPKGPVMVEHGSGLQAPLAGDWLDAATYSWQLRDARVSVRGASVGPVELHGPNGAKRTTKENYLHLLVQVSNVGVERELALLDWAGGDTEGITVTDATGKPLARPTFEGDWVPGQSRPATRAVPGHAVESYFLFNPPPAKSAYVQIRLAGSALGETEEIRFRAGLAPLAPRVPGK